MLALQRQKTEPKVLVEQKCALCDNHGIMDYEFYAALVSQRNTISLMSANVSTKTRKAFGLKDGESLKVLSWVPLSSQHSFFIHFNEKVKQSIQEVGRVCLCQECIVEHKVFK